MNQRLYRVGNSFWVSSSAVICLCGSSLQGCPCANLYTNSSIKRLCYSNVLCCNQRSVSEVILKLFYLLSQMLFFGSKCDRLCMLQFALISLIPGLIQHLEDCADPELDSYERNLSPPSSLKTSDRNSRTFHSKGGR